MYLFERIFALGVYVLALVNVCHSIIIRKTKIRCLRIITLYIAILVFFGYMFVPHQGADLTRLWIRMHLFASETWSQSFNRMLGNATPGAVLYFRLVGLLHNDHVLPALSVLITFSFSFGIIRSIVKKDNIDSSSIAISIFLFMSRGLLLQTMSNIRSMISISIIAWCIYQRFYNNRSIILLAPFYILAASFHSLGQALLIIRLLYLLVERRRNIQSKVISVMLFSFVAIIILRYGRNYIYLLLEHSESYFYGYQNGTGYAYIWEGILSVFSNLIVFFLIILFSKAYKRKTDSQDGISIATYRFTKFILLLILIDFVSIVIEFNFFQRLSWFISTLTIPYAIFALRELKKLGYGKVTIRNLYILSGIMLILACVRGDLCSLKFFVIS